MSTITLSYHQAHEMLDARKRGLTEAEVSLDLGLSNTRVPMDAAGVLMPVGGALAWETIEAIAESHSSVFALDGGIARAIQFYSQETQRLYSLYPTSGAPTMLISGIPMHRIKDTDPYQDTLEKVRTIKPLVGQVLDTATGLGYTAIQAARKAEHVTTIELEAAVLQVCRLNPWSQELFDNPRITQVIGDSFDVVAEMESNRFTRLIHDPPAFSLAGDLYSGDFYRQLLRVMRNKALLFHYIGDPESKSGGNITAGVMRRLEQAGFRQVRRAPRAFGVVAVK